MFAYKYRNGIDADMYFQLCHKHFEKDTDGYYRRNAQCK